MQFYKIVHTDAELEDENIRLRLKDYNVNKFLETHKSEINKVVNQAFVANLAKYVGKGIPYLVFPIVDIKQLYNLSNIAEEIIIREFGELSNKVLKDAINSSNNVIVITLENAKKKISKNKTIFR